MNILIYFENVINPFDGGTERASYNMALALRKQGHQIFTLAKRASHSHIDFPVFYLPDSPILSSANTLFVEKLVSEKNIDVIINEGGNNSDVQFFNHTNLDISCNIITHLHFSALQGFGKYFYQDVSLRSLKDYLRLLKLPFNRHNALKLFKHNYATALQHTDKFIVLHEEFKAQILHLTNLYHLGNKINIIPNINNLYPLKPLHDKHNTILYVGRLQYGTKRVDRLLKAWSYIQDQLPDWNIEIIGDGPDKTWYKKYAEGLSLKRVSFFGKCNPAPFYAKAKIITLVSTHESFGMTLVEGMTFGCVPVVFDSYPTARELTNNGQCGFLIPPFDTLSFAMTLLRLCQDKELLKKTSTQALAQVAKYSANTILTHWNEVFAQLRNKYHD